MMVLCFVWKTVDDETSDFGHGRGGGGGGGTNTTDDANNNTVAKKVLDAAKDALRRLQRRRSDLRFSKDALVADATANYRSKIGQPLVEKLPAKTPAKINEFIVDPFSFYREVCVVSILIYFARQTATAKRRRHRQRKERIKRSILKRMSKCETYAKYVTLEEELEKFEEDEDEEIAMVYCSSDKRGLKGAKERFGSSLNGFFGLSSRNTSTIEGEKKELVVDDRASWKGNTKERSTRVLRRESTIER